MILPKCTNHHFQDVVDFHLCSITSGKKMKLSLEVYRVMWNLEVGVVLGGKHEMMRLPSGHNRQLTHISSRWWLCTELKLLMANLHFSPLGVLSAILTNIRDEICNLPYFYFILFIFYFYFYILYLFICFILFVIYYYIYYLILLLFLLFFCKIQPRHPFIFICFKQ